MAAGEAFHGRRMVIELREPIGVITPLGEGYAILVEINNHDQWWTVILDNGALVTFPQNKLRVCRSYTHSRGLFTEEMKKIIGDYK
jgi:hypothetical protein